MSDNADELVMIATGIQNHTWLDGVELEPSSFAKEPYRRAWMALRGLDSDATPLDAQQAVVKQAPGIDSSVFMTDHTDVLPEAFQRRAKRVGVAAEARAFDQSLQDAKDARERGVDPEEVRDHLLSRMTPLVARRELENLWLGARTFNHQDPIPPRPWLVGDEAEPVIPQGKVAILAGEGAIGKSTLLIDLALSVAAGKPWLGFTTSPGSVLLVAGEEDQNDIQRRLKTGLTDWSEAATKTVLDRLVIVPGAGRSLTLMDDRGGPTALCRELIGRLQAPPDHGEGWSLIALDPLSRFASSAVEIDNVAATAFVSLMERLLTVPGKPTVLLTHHTSQIARNEQSGAATGVRGVTGLTDAVRCVLTMTKTKTKTKNDDVPKNGDVHLNVPKQNYGRGLPPIPLIREGARLVMNQQRKSTKSTKGMAWEK